MASTGPPLRGGTNAVFGGLCAVLFMENNAQKRAVYFKRPAAVADEAELSEFVHEEIHAGTSRAHHLGEHFLRNLRQHFIRLVFLAVSRQQQQRTCKALLARIEKLIDKIFFHANIARKHVSDEAVREGMF